MNVLVINLTRFGDLLQMQPAILGLKAQGHKVCLLCLQNFYAASSLLRGVDHVVGMSGAKFLQGLDEDWRLALSSVEDVVAEIETKFPVHMVINTTSSLGARLLAKRIATSIEGDVIPILGFGLDDDGFGVSGDMWATFLQGASVERLNCPFNLVDMFRSVCKVADLPTYWGLQTPSQIIQTESLELIKSKMPDNCKGFVALQLGASDAKRQWAVEHFANLGQKLWHEHGLCPILLGTKAEKELEVAYAKLAKNFPHPFMSVMGETDIPHLAGVLSHCKLLISNDTGTMHLAAGLKIPVLAIFLATAQAWDTGPYMPDCCCLEPSLPCHPCAFNKPCIYGENNQSCLRSISPETVFHLINEYLQNKAWPRFEQDEARIWQSIEEPDGFASLKGLSGHELEERSQWIMMQRHFYRQILDNKMNATSYTSNYLSSTLSLNVGTTMQQGAALLLLLEKQIEIMLAMPSSQNGERLLATCNKFHKILDGCHYLKALAHLWATLSQEQGSDLIVFLNFIKPLRQVLMQWHLAIEKSGT